MQGRSMRNMLWTAGCRAATIPHATLMADQVYFSSMMIRHRLSAIRLEERDLKPRVPPVTPCVLRTGCQNGNTDRGFFGHNDDRNWGNLNCCFKGLTDLCKDTMKPPCKCAHNEPDVCESRRRRWRRGEAMKASWSVDMRASWLFVLARAHAQAEVTHGGPFSGAGVPATPAPNFEGGESP